METSDKAQILQSAVGRVERGARGGEEGWIPVDSWGYCPLCEEVSLRLHQPGHDLYISRYKRLRIDHLEQFTLEVLTDPRLHVLLAHRVGDVGEGSEQVHLIRVIDLVGHPALGSTLPLVNEAHPVDARSRDKE